jgi:hypothetical protein
MVYHAIMLWLIFNELVLLGVLNVQIKDDWEKPRRQSQHLTKEEISMLRVAFNVGRKPQDIARELQCSSRVANKYNAMFRGTPHKCQERKQRPERVEIASPSPKPRFYKSNFEL